MLGGFEEINIDESMNTKLGGDQTVGFEES